MHNHYADFKSGYDEHCEKQYGLETIQFGEDVPNNILYPVPHRPFVFSIPIVPRIYFKYDRRLQAKLCHCANESLQRFFRTLLDLDDGVLGMTIVVPTFGDYARQKACPGPRSGITNLEEIGKVLCRSAMSHGSNKKDFEIYLTSPSL